MASHIERRKFFSRARRRGSGVAARGARAAAGDAGDRFSQEHDGKPALRNLSPRSDKG
jgi:hypothetical protein